MFPVTNSNITTLFVNKRQDNEDVQIRKQSYTLNLRIEGSRIRAIKAIFEMVSSKASK